MRIQTGSTLPNGYMVTKLDQNGIELRKEGEWVHLPLGLLKSFDRTCSNASHHWKIVYLKTTQGLIGPASFASSVRKGRGLPHICNKLPQQNRKSSAAIPFGNALPLNTHRRSLTLFGIFTITSLLWNLLSYRAGSNTGQAALHQHRRFAQPRWSAQRPLPY